MLPGGLDESIVFEEFVRGRILFGFGLRRIPGGRGRFRRGCLCAAFFRTGRAGDEAEERGEDGQKGEKDWFQRRTPCEFGTLRISYRMQVKSGRGVMIRFG